MIDTEDMRDIITTQHNVISSHNFLSHIFDRWRMK